MLGAGVPTPVARIEADKAELEARRDEARGAMELAQAQLDKVTVGPREVEVDAFRAREKAAQAQLEELARGARHEDVDHATGSRVMVCIDPKTRKPTPWSEELRRLVAPFVEEQK